MKERKRGDGLPLTRKRRRLSTTANTGEGRRITGNAKKPLRPAEKRKAGLPTLNTGEKGGGEQDDGKRLMAAKRCLKARGFMNQREGVWVADVQRARRKINSPVL